ncbi:MAG: MFS transporter [Lactobacillales bacterium]|jgi:acyl-[acyl-carrier-protein]-phospholipid O-acyltransferase/long-chain-fatty-acid--[acyl-carrier-protein] ligase|nr:MFS transporter [Lactobacillales bacterium]
MFLKLFTDKKFFPLLGSHFISAVNDHLIQLVFLFFVTFKIAGSSTTLLIFSLLLYALCFCTGAVFAGQFADKTSKTKFLQYIRIVEMGLMLLALLSISFHSRLILMFILAGMGFVSACLRVSDYSLITQLLSRGHLNLGNILMKASTLVSVALAGAILALVWKYKDDYFVISYYVVCLLGLVLSVAGFLLTLKLPQTQAVDPDSTLSKNPIKVFDYIAQTIKNKFDIWTYLVGIAWFWIFASLIFAFASEYAQIVLKARWSAIIFLMAGVFPLGYCAGSFIYAHLSKKGNLTWHIPLVTLFTSVVVLDFIAASYSILTDLNMDGKTLSISKMFTGGFFYWHILADIFVLGALAALYVIPFYTLLQLSTPPKNMGRMMSFSNLVNAIGVAGAFLVILSFRLLSFNVLDLLLFFALANIFMAVYMTRLLPKKSRRTLFKWVLQKLFQVEIHGLENLNKAGRRALIVTNHTSFLDVLLISTFIERPIVFAINNHLIDKTIVKFMTNLVDVRPLDPLSPFAVKDMVEELRQDKLCMIFTEGVIEGGNTRMKIYEGPAMMALKGEAPILPIQIKGAANTFFSRVLGKKAHFKFFPKIEINVLPPVDFNLPDDLTTREAREKSSSKLYDVLSEMTFTAYDTGRTVFGAIADSMRMVGRFKPIMEDTDRKPVKFYSLFMKSFILGKLIHRATPDESYVGLMVPTSNTCVLSFFGLHAFGKTPAMINFSSGPKQVIATCQTVGLKTIVTAKKVVLLAKLEALVEAIEKAGVRVLYLEDLRPTLRFTDKLLGIFGAFFPKKVYQNTVGKMPAPTDPAVILFTSGSEGMPKAVFLTHKNMLSNCYQVPARYDIFGTDIFLNCLPMFHSFGLEAGTILPLLLGVKTVLYPTPLHYRIIPEICAATKATVFFGTDTFLSGYAKCANPYDFNSLRIVVSGAEKVKDETRKIWSEKFGVRVLEGYGATECAPVIAVNTFLHQKVGSVGRILPGMSYKLKTVEGIKEGKELLVKGPNVMLGYMRYEKPLELDPPKEGWYDTGDIVHVDEEGYIFIRGRAKRFAKIGGEMVSLLAVEQLVEKNWPGFISGTVSIPDPKKGEQIVLITTCKDITKEALIMAFKTAGVAELGIPSKIIVTDNPPLLGTGKFDYVTAKEIAQK